MPVTEITSISKNSTDGLRYLFYGTYKLTDVVNGRVHYNQAHPNHNGVTRRNELVTGINCRPDYKGAVKDFDFYNKQKPNRKNQAMMITMSFDKKDFNFSKPEDVYRATSIGRNLVKKAFPDRPVIIAAQHDGHSGTPHLHIYPSNFRIDNLKAFNKYQTNIYHLRHVADQVTHQYNINNPTHKITEMKDYQKKKHHHNRTPTPAEMSIMPGMKYVLSHNPTSQNNMRKLARQYNQAHHDGFRVSFKGIGRRSGGRRRRGRRRRRRGMLVKTNSSHGWIPISKERYFDHYCPGVGKLHNNYGRRKLFKHNWAKVQSARTAEIKTIADKMNKAHIMTDLYHVGNVDGLDDFKWRAKNQAGVLVSFKNYTKRNGDPGQSIRYRLKGHRHSYSGYQFVKMFGQAGRRFNNYDVQNHIEKNREAIINFENQNDGSLESTFNAVGTTGKRDLDSQLSITPSTVQDDEQNPATKHESSNDESMSTPTDNTAIAKKRKEIHSYYQTKEDDRKAIDKFIAKLDRAVKAQARAVEIAMIHLRKRTNKWIKEHAIKPLKYKTIKARDKSSHGLLHDKDWKGIKRFEINYSKALSNKDDDLDRHYRGDHERE